MSILRGIKSELEKETTYSIIQKLIVDEEEAIDGYETAKEQLKYIPTMKYNEYLKAEEVFNHIIEEEKEHIEELQQLKLSIKEVQQDE